MLSFDGREVHGFALGDYPAREGAVFAAREQGGALGAVVACPECSWVAPFLGGMVITGVAFTIAGVYLATGPKQRLTKPEPEPEPTHRPKPKPKK